jgi:hypothetical protein
MCICVRAGEPRSVKGGLTLGNRVFAADRFCPASAVAEERSVAQATHARPAGRCSPARAAGGTWSHLIALAFAETPSKMAQIAPTRGLDRAAL